MTLTPIFTICTQSIDGEEQKENIHPLMRSENILQKKNIYQEENIHEKENIHQKENIHPLWWGLKTQKRSWCIAGESLQFGRNSKLIFLA